MANNIIDIITRLDYKSDTKGLEEGYNALLKNIQAVDEQSKSVQRLEAVRAKTDKDNLARLQLIDKAIENRKNKINQEINVMKGLVAENDKLKRSIEANVALYNKITRAGNTVVTNQGKIAESSKSATFALTNLSYVVQDLPFGFIGIANNVTPLVQSFSQLKAESGSTGAAFKTLLKSFMGPQGLFFAVSTITSLLLVFGDRLFSSGKEAEKAAEKITDYDRAIQSAAKSIGDEITKLDRLLSVSSDTTKKYNERSDAVDELQKIYPDYFGNLEREKILNGEVGETYRALTEDIIKRAKATAQYNLLEKEQEELFKAMVERDRVTNNTDPNTFFYDPTKQIESLDREISLRERNIKAIEKTINAQNVLNEFDAFWADPKAREQFMKKQDEARKRALMTEDERKQYDSRSKNEKVNDAAEALRIPTPDDLDELIKEYKEQEQKIRNAIRAFLEPIHERYAKEVTGVTLSDEEAASLNADLNIQQNLKKARKRQEEAKAARRKKNKERREAIIESAQDTANALIEIMESVSERQIQLLDYEIQIRQQRVQQAMELAKAGNAEILQQEQERLNKAQEEREKVARRQLVVNQALQASSAAIAATQAIQTVTNAGSTGDPYSTAARIAAAVAALAAGFAFVSSLVNAFNVDSFKDGVVDYKGSGTETSDSNLVRISNRESVMTAEATKRYKPILMAMNENKPLPLPYALEPNNGQRNGGYGELKKEFQMLRSAFENSGIRVNTNVTNGHIATIVESEKRISGRTWN